jgi:hypothetical protein
MSMDGLYFSHRKQTNDQGNEFIADVRGHGRKWLVFVNRESGWPSFFNT